MILKVTAIFRKKERDFNSRFDSTDLPVYPVFTFCPIFFISVWHFLDNASIWPGKENEAVILVVGL